MPNSVSELIENPSRYMPAKVPISDTGTATDGITVARRLYRNSQTTQKTSTSASKNVSATSRIDTRTYLLVSYGIEYVRPAGNRGESSSIFL